MILTLENQNILLAMAAMFYTKYGTYAETERRLNACLVGIPFGSFKLQQELKRLGFGLKSTQGTSYKIGENGWTLVDIHTRTYQRWWLKSEVQRNFFISHHHSNGAAYEIRLGSKWKDLNKCINCGAKIPDQITVWIKLRQLSKYV